jgi:hypothetical protein
MPARKNPQARSAAGGRRITSNVGNSIKFAIKTRPVKTSQSDSLFRPKNSLFRQENSLFTRKKFPVPPCSGN